MNKGNLLVLISHCCTQSPSEALPEFLVWFLVNFYWLGKVKNPGPYQLYPLTLLHQHSKVLVVLIFFLPLGKIVVRIFLSLWRLKLLILLIKWIWARFVYVLIFYVLDIFVGYVLLCNDCSILLPNFYCFDCLSYWCVCVCVCVCVRREEGSFLYILHHYLSMDFLKRNSLKKNLFIFGRAGSLLLCGPFSSCSERGLLSSCSVWALHCGGFSWCGAGALGQGDFSSCGSWGLEHRLNSIVVMHRLSCSTVYGIFLDEGSNPCLCLLYWQLDSSPMNHQGSPLYGLILTMIGAFLSQFKCHFLRETFPFIQSRGAIWSLCITKLYHCVTNSFVVFLICLLLSISTHLRVSSMRAGPHLYFLHRLMDESREHNMGWKKSENTYYTLPFM